MVQSNSTITNLSFNSTSHQLAFTASGPSGTYGLTKVTIAKSLVEDATAFSIALDGNQLEFSIESADDSWVLLFSYHHSSHQVVIGLTPNALIALNNAPQDYTLLIVAVVIASATLFVGAFFVKRKHKN